VLQALRRLLLQGALRVVLVAVTTVCVMGFLSLVAATSQVPVPALADAMAQSRACMPSQCRAKAETRSPQTNRRTRCFAPESSIFEPVPGSGSYRQNGCGQTGPPAIDQPQISPFRANL
jgi:hypothetical protein